MNWSTVLAAGGFPPVSLKVFNGEVSFAVVGDGPAFVWVQGFEDGELFAAIAAPCAVAVKYVFVLVVAAELWFAHCGSLVGAGIAGPLGISGLPCLSAGLSPASISLRQPMQFQWLFLSCGWSGHGWRGFFSRLVGTVVFQMSSAVGNSRGCVHRGLPCFSALQ